MKAVGSQTSSAWELLFQSACLHPLLWYRTLLWSFFLNNFIYLFLIALGLCCCMWAFSSCSEQELLFISVQASHFGGFSCWAQILEQGLSSCGAWAQLPHSMWNLPRPGIKPMSPALPGELFTTTTREALERSYVPEFFENHSTRQLLSMC